MSIIENRAKNDPFLLMMLSRFITDCEYFLGFGGRNEKCLWSTDVESHIKNMLEVYDYVDPKPEWLTKEQIEDYKNQMIS